MTSCVVHIYMESEEFQKMMNAIETTIAKTNNLKKASTTLNLACEGDFESKIDDYLSSLSQLQALTNELADDVLDEPIPEDLLACEKCSLVSEGKRPDEYNAKLKQELDDLRSRSSTRAEELHQISGEFSSSLHASNNP